MKRSTIERQERAARQAEREEAARQADPILKARAEVKRQNAAVKAAQVELEKIEQLTELLMERVKEARKHAGIATWDAVGTLSHYRQTLSEMLGEEI